MTRSSAETGRLAIGRLLPIFAVKNLPPAKSGKDIRAAQLEAAKAQRERIEAERRAAQARTLTNEPAEDQRVEGAPPSHPPALAPPPTPAPRRSSPLAVAFGIAGVALIAVCAFFSVQALWARDRMLRDLFNNHYELWKSEGCPHGWLWRPRGEWSRSLRWPVRGSLKQDPAWLQVAPDLEPDFREWQKATARAGRFFWPALAIGLVGAIIASFSR